jgi:hypothetical protein
VTVTELIAAAKRFKPTAEDVRRLVATCEKVDQEQQARGWNPVSILLG